MLRIVKSKWYMVNSDSTCGEGSGFFAVADMVDESHKEAEAEESAGGEDEEKHAVGTADEVDAEEAAGAESLADHAEEGESPSEAQTDEEAVEEGMPDVVLGCESFSATQNDAVDDNQRDEETQRGVEVGDEALHDHLDDGDECCDDNDEAGNTHLVGH